MHSKSKDNTSTNIMKTMYKYALKIKRQHKYKYNEDNV